MNILTMAKHWRNEGKTISKLNLNRSIRRGTYTQKNIDNFVRDVDHCGFDKAEAARRNNIPKGSRHHVYNMATAAGLSA